MEENVVLKRKDRMAPNSNDESDTDNAKLCKIMKVTNSTCVVKTTYAEKLYLEMQELSHNVDRQFGKLADIDKSTLDALHDHRRLALQNEDNFKKDFPFGSSGLMHEFYKANAQNHIIDDLEKARKEQVLLFTRCRQNLAEMRRSFETDYPDFKPRDGHYSITRRIPAPATLYSDYFLTVWTTVWTLNPEKRRYEPRRNQQVINIGRQMWVNMAFHKQVVYVEMKRGDVKDGL
ncbi:hypothetical protein DSL72_002778 [Monilinia vaccinii-corymbosi]|uniref:Uncharacterized protein n=1 Tax=Monilinia vaccinii-corymbosi TaxID=61207 RepID=A0A8A3PDE2_9HELO|nr:hypothetical protein DSL72_002778 [Monilinia vaccinii-corymbosi]